MPSHIIELWGPYAVVFETVTPITSVYSHCHTVLLLVFLSSLTHTPLFICTASATRSTQSPSAKERDLPLSSSQGQGSETETIINEP